MRKFETVSDIGSVSVFTKDAKWHFSNGVGNGWNRVEIYEGIHTGPEDGKFVDCFEVFTKAYLANYDCQPHKALYTFTKGRWGVYREAGTRMIFVRWE